MSIKRRFKLDKLIRDKMPELLAEDNIVLNHRVMNEEEYIQRLKEKLLEEAQEVFEAKTTVELTEELADVLEVLYALGRAHGLTQDNIEHVRIQKKQTNGGFDNRLYSAFVEYTDNHPQLPYAVERPEKYPEIFESTSGN